MSKLSGLGYSRDKTKGHCCSYLQQQQQTNGSVKAFVSSKTRLANWLGTTVGPRNRIKQHSYIPSLRQSNIIKLFQNNFPVLFRARDCREGNLWNCANVFNGINTNLFFNTNLCLMCKSLFNVQISLNSLSPVSLFFFSLALSHLLTYVSRPWGASTTNALVKGCARHVSQRLLLHLGLTHSIHHLTSSCFNHLPYFAMRLYLLKLLNQAPLALWLRRDGWFNRW